MTIRFQCGSCSQPIEVDDEWASKTVACPYCRKTVTAPAESTFTDLSRIPTASPLAPGVGVPPPTPSQAPHQDVIDAEFAVSRTDAPNRIALVALVLACCSIGLLLISQMILSPHRLEMEDLQEATMNAQGFTERMEAQSAFFESHPAAVRWLVPALLVVTGSGLTSIAAIVCGLVGVRRPRRRRMAAVSLAIAVVPVFFFCCGGLIFGSMR